MEGSEPGNVSQPATPIDDAGPCDAAVSLPAEDEELLRALQEEKTWAQRVLFEEHADRLASLLERILGPSSIGGEDSDDLTQEVFIRAFDRIQRVSDPQALTSWLTAIAVNVAREALKRRRRPLLRWLGLEAVAEPEAPVASPELRASLRAFYAVVDALPVEERVPFTLRVVGQLDLREIAIATGTSLATVKRRLARAREKFLRRARQHPDLEHWLEENHG